MTFSEFCLSSCTEAVEGSFTCLAATDFLLLLLIVQVDVYVLVLVATWYFNRMWQRAAVSELDRKIYMFPEIMKMAWCFGPFMIFYLPFLSFDRRKDIQEAEAAARGQQTLAGPVVSPEHWPVASGS
mmetsp:Transcript_19083/g.61055  ORF Transcript_19083/g.61055 Transcript_19083/m.61055 type:complete len:127 (+) Transcript_19083:322-702(+)